MSTGSVPETPPAKSGATKWIAITVVVVVIVAGLGYYFLYNTRPTNASVSVTMPSGVGTNQNLNFQPSTITVVLGVNNTVVWINADSSVPAHTVVNTTAPIPFGSSTILINNGQSFSFTFTTPGTYNYVCTIHPSYMKGTVIVKAHA